ncbi:MAG: ubiquinone/menaquinone biosynthesis methyltransferase [Desulfobacterales bacterium]|nr:ubiquinone/menaquinone biosynthesis methyltransferase [Desulfobacterales bacterium]
MIQKMGKSKYVRRMFDRIAHRYDLINRIMTFGQDRVWRRYMVSLSGIKLGYRVLDIGAGTGSIGSEICARYSDVSVINADFSLEMMRNGQAREKNSNSMWCCADAQDLPFADETMDVVTSAYLIRNVSDIQKTFSEKLRVVKPGGYMVCLETSPPKKNIMLPLIMVYFEWIIPLLGLLISGNRQAYQYLPQTTRLFFEPDVLANYMKRIGFVDVSFRSFMFGTIVVFRGKRPGISISG